MRAAAATHSPHSFEGRGLLMKICAWEGRREIFAVAGGAQMVGFLSQ
jgi:hypothetical protein